MANLKPGWKIVKFGDVVRNLKISIDRDNNSYERYVAGEHMCTDDVHIREWGVFDGSYVGPAFHRLFQKGQVLYGSRRTYLRKVALADFDGITANTTFVLESKNPEVLLQNLLPFIMLTDDFTTHSIKESKGSTNPYINWPDIAKYEFPLPPLDEQKHMAEILWVADEAVETWGRTISTLQRLSRVISVRKFLLHEARKQTPKLPLGWRLGTIDELAAIDPRIPRDLNDEMEVSFVTMDDVSEQGGITNRTIKSFSEVKNGYTYFGEGDILFAKITPCMENNKGAIAKDLTNSIGMGSTEFFVFRPKNESDRQFLYCLTMSEIYRKRAERWMQGSAGQRRVPRDFFSKRPIVIPSEEDRITLGKALGAIDTRIKETQQHINRLRTSRMYLLNVIFSDNSEVANVQ